MKVRKVNQAMRGTRPRLSPDSPDPYMGGVMCSLCGTILPLSIPCHKLNRKIVIGWQGKANRLYLRAWTRFDRAGPRVAVAKNGAAGQVESHAIPWICNHSNIPTREYKNRSNIDVCKYLHMRIILMCKDQDIWICAYENDSNIDKSKYVNVWMFALSPKYLSEESWYR